MEGHKDQSIHIGQKLFKLNSVHTEELGHLVYVAEGEVEEISVFNGECCIDIRWEYGACQSIKLSNIGNMAFLDRSEPIIRLLALVDTRLTQSPAPPHPKGGCVDWSANKNNVGCCRHD